MNNREQNEAVLKEYYRDDKKQFLKNEIPEYKGKLNKEHDETLLSNEELFMKFINCKFKKKKPKKSKTTPIMSRLSTMTNAVLQTIVIILDMDIPKYDDAAEKKKQEIFGYVKGKSAINNEHDAKHNGGDHMFGTNEAPYDYVNGFKPVGSNSQWNMLPCTQSENVNWKILKIPGYPQIKNIVYDYDKITPEIYALMSLEKRNYYDKFKLWSEYCNSRKAEMYHKISKEIYDYGINSTKNHLNALNTEIIEKYRKIKDADAKMLELHAGQASHLFPVSPQQQSNL